jgi:hypothetical protein
MESKIAHDICKEFADKVQGLIFDILDKELPAYKTQTMKDYVTNNAKIKYIETLDKITDIEQILKELQA